MKKPKYHMEKEDITSTTTINTRPSSVVPFVVAALYLVGVNIVGARSNAVGLPLDRAPQPAPVVPDLAIEQKARQVAGHTECYFFVVG